MHLPDRRDDRVVEAEAGPADYADAPDLAVRADLGLGVHGRLGLRAAGRVRVCGPETPVGRRLAQVCVRARALLRGEVNQAHAFVRGRVEALALLARERFLNRGGVARGAPVQLFEEGAFRPFGLVGLGYGAVPEDEPPGAR